MGTGDLTSRLDVSYLPVITLRNNTSGAMVETADPGRALMTGLWADIGKVKGPILRGLAARAPYFEERLCRQLKRRRHFLRQTLERRFH